MLNLEPIDDFSEKSPDIEQLQATQKTANQRYRNTRLLAVLIFFTCWGMVGLLTNRYIPHHLADYAAVLTGLAAMTGALVVAAATWFYLKTQLCTHDIQSKTEGKFAFFTKNPLNVMLIAGAFFGLVFFLWFVENFGIEFRGMMPFRNHMNKELAAAMFFCLWLVGIGLLLVTAALRYCLEAYTNTYEQHEQHDKTRMLRSVFLTSLRDLAVMLFIGFVLALFGVDGYLRRNFGYWISERAFIFAFLVYFYYFCKFVGCGLLWWEVKARKYDGV